MDNPTEPTWSRHRKPRSTGILRGAAQRVHQQCGILLKDLRVQMQTPRMSRSMESGHGLIVDQSLNCECINIVLQAAAINKNCFLFAMPSKVSFPHTGLNYLEVGHDHHHW